MNRIPRRTRARCLTSEAQRGLNRAGRRDRLVTAGRMGGGTVLTGEVGTRGGVARGGTRTGGAPGRIAARNSCSAWNQNSSSRPAGEPALSQSERARSATVSWLGVFSFIVPVGV